MKRRTARNVTKLQNKDIYYMCPKQCTFLEGQTIQQRKVYSLSIQWKTVPPNVHEYF